MVISKKHQVFLAISIFLALGFFAIYMTHDNKATYLEKENGVSLVDAENYVEHIRPWLLSAIDDPSLKNIRSIKNNLYNFRSSERNIGSAHINLFLVFNFWENYLTSGEPIYKENALEKIIVVEDYIPSISGELSAINNILSDV